MNTPYTIPPKQYALLVNKTDRAIRKRCALEQIKARKIGGTWLIHESEYRKAERMLQ